MVDTINAFFSWVYRILDVWLNTVIVDGYKYIHIYIFLALVFVIVTFIHDRVGRRNDKSE